MNPSKLVATHLYCITPPVRQRKSRMLCDGPFRPKHPEKRLILGSIWKNELRSAGCLQPRPATPLTRRRCFLNYSCPTILSGPNFFPANPCGQPPPCAKYTDSVRRQFAASSSNSVWSKSCSPQTHPFRGFHEGAKHQCLAPTSIFRFGNARSVLSSSNTHSTTCNAGTGHDCLAVYRASTCHIL